MPQVEERGWSWGHRESSVTAREVVAGTVVRRGDEEVPVALRAPRPRAGACGCLVLSTV